MNSHATEDVELHDFDLDDDLDVLSTELILLNDGSGNFTVAKVLDGPGYAADLDGDGDVDVIQKNATTGAIELLKNLAIEGHTGGFDAPVSPFSLVGASEPTSIRALADVSGDGIADLISDAHDLISDEATLTFYINNGLGTFTRLKTLVLDIAIAVADMHFADLNNDKTNDLITLTYGGNYDMPYRAQPRTYLNDGSGNFTFVGLTTDNSRDRYHTAMAIGDLDNDGYNDLYWSTVGEDEVYLNDGTGTFTFAGNNGSVGGLGEDVELADLDFDGDLDAVVLGGVNPGVYFNDSHGVFSLSNQPFPSGSESEMIGAALGDLDGDGGPDMYAATDDGNRDLVHLNVPGVRIGDIMTGVYENPEVGAYVGRAQVDAVAPGDSITFEIFDIPDHDRDMPDALSIDPVTGELFVVDPSVFDRELHGSLFVAVRGTNLTGAVGEGEVTFMLGDLSEDPERLPRSLRRHQHRHVRRLGESARPGGQRHSVCRYRRNCW